MNLKKNHISLDTK